MQIRLLGYERADGLRLARSSFDLGGNGSIPALDCGWCRNRPRCCGAGPGRGLRLIRGSSDGPRAASGKLQVARQNHAFPQNLLCVHIFLPSKKRCPDFPRRARGFGTARW